MLTEHSAIVLPVIFRKSGLPPAVEVKHRCVMSDANLSLRSSFYFVLRFLCLSHSLYLSLCPSTKSTCTQNIILVKYPLRVQKPRFSRATQPKVIIKMRLLAIHIKYFFSFYNRTCQHIAHMQKVDKMAGTFKYIIKSSTTPHKKLISISNSLNLK